MDLSIGVLLLEGHIVVELFEILAKIAEFGFKVLI